MPQNIPEQQSTLRADISRELERISKTTSKQFEDIIGNARWFTTLVIAEVAGIANLAESAKRWQFGVVVVALSLLAISAGFLIASITLAQSLKNKTEKAVVSILVDLPVTDLSDAQPQEVGELLKTVKDSLAITDDDAEPQARSTVGLLLFLVGSFVAGIALFLG